MSLEEIKDIKKLREIAKSAIEESKHLKKCCVAAGKELAKYTFDYDYKEKNLVVQAKKLNERFEELGKSNKAMIDSLVRMQEQLNMIKNPKYQDDISEVWFKTSVKYKAVVEEIEKYVSKQIIDGLDNIKEVRDKHIMLYYILDIIGKEQE